MNKKTLTSFMYQMRDDRKSVIIYYSILIACYLALFISAGVVAISEDGAQTYFMSNGHGLPTAIFLFCACAVTENFLMLTQNGVSRKSIFIGRLLDSIVLAFGMAVIDTIIEVIFKSVVDLMGENYMFLSIYDMMFNQFNDGLFIVLKILISILFFFTLFLFTHTLGYLMSNTFNRLGKTAKVIFAAGIPTFIFVVFPVIDAVYFDMQFSEKILTLLWKMLGMEAQQPFYSILTFTIGAVVCSCLTWLLMRRKRVE
jgi:hypothetical protein